MRAGEVVPPVDLVAGDALGALALGQPVLVHQLGEARGVAALERDRDAPAELADLVEVGDHGLVVLLGALLLVGEDRGGPTRVPGEEQQQVLLEVGEGLVGDRQALDLDGAVGRELERVRPPNAAMYWSCLPTGSPSRSISMWQAASARAWVERWSWR